MASKAGARSSSASLSDDWCIFDADSNSGDSDDFRPESFLQDDDEHIERLVFKGTVSFCRVCNVPIMGDGNWSAHKKGRKHKGRMERIRFCRSQRISFTETKHAPTRMTLSHFVCNNCKLEVCGLDQWESHIRGKQHAKHVATLGVQRSNRPHLQHVLAGHAQWTDDLEPTAKNILISSLTVQSSDQKFDWETQLRVAEDFDERVTSAARFSATLTLPLREPYIATGSGSTKKEASLRVAVDACKHLSSLGLLLVPTGLDGSITTDFIRVPKEYHCRIIGKQGVKRKEIMEKSCTFIRVPGKLDANEDIEIVGDQEAINHAKELMKAVIPSNQTARRGSGTSSSALTSQHRTGQRQPPRQRPPPQALQTFEF